MNTKLADYKPEILDLQRNVNSITMWWQCPHDKLVNYYLLEKYIWPDEDTDTFTERVEARILNYPTYEDRHVSPPRTGVNYSYRVKFFFKDDTESDWSDSPCVMSSDPTISEVRENARKQAAGESTDRPSNSE